MVRMVEAMVWALAMTAMVAVSQAASQPSPAAAPKIDTATTATLGVEGVAPGLEGAGAWLNSPALRLQQLHGKVVLVDFWTYSCINCQHVLPYVNTWAARYRDQGLVVIGIHAPEFDFERSVPNVEQVLRKLHIEYPVAIDNDFTIWRRYHNQFWPARYLIDAQGRIRSHHFGEGAYDVTEQQIRQLLDEAHAPEARELRHT